LDAGLVSLGSIGDTVWSDSDRDGLQDPGEPGAGGVTVRLLNGSGQLLRGTTTDGLGRYSFTGLLAGTYQVEFVAPADYAFTLCDQGTDDALDSDADPVTGRGVAITLGLGQSRSDVDAGLLAA